MQSLENWELPIYFLTMVAITSLSTLAGAESRVNRQKLNVTKIIKKICWGIVIISSAYWTITFPHVGSYYDFSNKSEYPAELNADKEAAYIKEYHQRIENLERETKETKEELRAVRERLDLILGIIMLGIITYGCNQIFNSKKKTLEEIQPNTNQN